MIDLIARVAEATILAVLPILRSPRIATQLVQNSEHLGLMPVQFMAVRTISG